MSRPPAEVTTGRSRSTGSHEKPSGLELSPSAAWRDRASGGGGSGTGRDNDLGTDRDTDRDDDRDTDLDAGAPSPDAGPVRDGLETIVLDPFSTCGGRSS